MGATRRAVGAVVPTGARGRTRAARAGDRPGCVDRGLPQREGTGRADVQGHLRLPPDARVLRHHGEFLAARLRRGNAGANTAADHIDVLDQALAQIPDIHRHGREILVRADTAGCTREFLAHVRSQHDEAVSCEFSVGWAITAKERAAITAIPKTVWADAIDADGGHRDGAGLAEITHVLPAAALAGYPARTRVVVRRERPHPGAQLDAFKERDGWRYTAFATDTRVGQLAALDARHRAHARVEDRIRTAKDTGLDHFPSRSFPINTAWLTVVMLAVDLIAWTQHLLLHDQPALARAEPKALRYRLLHVAARLTRGGRRTWLRIQRTWPWANQIAAAFAICAALPQPVH